MFGFVVYWSVKLPVKTLTLLSPSLNYKTEESQQGPQQNDQYYNHMNSHILVYFKPRYIYIVFNFISCLDLVIGAQILIEAF